MMHLLISPAFCAVSTYKSAVLVQMKFSVSSVAIFTANNYGSKFISAATLAINGNATGAQNYTLVPSATTAGSVYFTLAVVTTSVSADANSYAQTLKTAVSVPTSTTGVLLYKYLNSSSITLSGVSVPINMGGLLDSSYVPTVTVAASISQCTDGTWQVQCTPCGAPKCIRLYPNAFSAAAIARPVFAGAVLLLAVALLW